MVAVLIIAIIAVSYVVSTRIHPLRKCPTCNMSGRHFAGVYKALFEGEGLSVVELPRFAIPKMLVWMKQLVMFTGSDSTAHNPHPNLPSSNRTAVSLTETVSTVTSPA